MQMPTFELGASACGLLARHGLADIFLAAITERIELGSIRANDNPVRVDAAGQTRVLDEIVELSKARFQRLYFLPGIVWR